MTNLTRDDILNYVYSTRDRDELLEVNRILIQRVKDLRSEDSRRAKHSLSVGMTVTFQGRGGRTLEGTITKLAQKYCTVDCGGFRNQWRVPMSEVTEVSAQAATA